MKRRNFLAVALGGWSAASNAANAWPSKEIPVVGVLASGTPDPSAAISFFRQGLRELGYVDGRNIRIEVRSAEGNSARLSELAEALVRQRVDVIAAWFTPVVLAAKRATSTIPIVMMAAGDPVGVGLVASLARPGGNVTGMAGQTNELAGKHVELLKEAVPTIEHIAALCNAADPFAARFLRYIEAAGKDQKIAVTPVSVTSTLRLTSAFAEVVGARVPAVIVQPSLALKHAAHLAQQHRLAAAAPFESFAQMGGLMAYSIKPSDYYRRAAIFVAQILKGAKPADLPVEQPMRFQLVINLKTARAIDLTLPNSLLAQADEVIE